MTKSHESDDKESFNHVTATTKTLKAISWTGTISTKGETATTKSLQIKIKERQSTIDDARDRAR